MRSLLATISVVSFIALSQSATVQSSLRSQSKSIYQPSFNLVETEAEKFNFDKLKQAAKKQGSALLKQGVASVTGAEVVT